MCLLINFRSRNIPFWMSCRRGILVRGFRFEIRQIVKHHLSRSLLAKGLEGEDEGDRRARVSNVERSERKERGGGPEGRTVPRRHTTRAAAHNLHTRCTRWTRLPVCSTWRTHPISYVRPFIRAIIHLMSLLLITPTVGLYSTLI